MQHKSVKTTLRWFFRLQIVCLCVTLAAIGVCVAAERTAYTAQGAPAAVQTDTPADPVVSHLPDKSTLASLTEYAPLLPAPFGNLAAVFLSIQNIPKNAFSETLDKLHKFFF